jgi:hypothetical protein
MDKRAQEWTKHEKEITSLYRKNTLNRVMQLMSEKHGFYGTYDYYSPTDQ